MSYRKDKDKDKIQPGEKDMYCVDMKSGRRIKQSDARIDPDGYVVHKSNLDAPSNRHYQDLKPRPQVRPDPMRPEDEGVSLGRKELLYPRPVIARLAATLTRLVQTSYTASIVATGTVTSFITKLLSQAASATATGSASIIKAISYALSATATGTASVTKAISIALSATATGTASLATSLVSTFTGTATATGTSTLVKQALVNYALTATGTNSLAKAIATSFSSTATGTNALTKQAQTIYSMTGTGTASLVTLATIASGLGLDQFEILNNNYTDRFPAQSNYALIHILR